MVELSHKLKALRLKKGLTQGQVAKLLGVTTSVVSAYECSIRNPSYENLIGLARIFKVSTDYLLGVETRDSSLALKTDGLSNEELRCVQNLIDILRRK